MKFSVTEVPSWKRGFFAKVSSPITLKLMKSLFSFRVKRRREKKPWGRGWSLLGKTEKKSYSLRYFVPVEQFLPEVIRQTLIWLWLNVICVKVGFTRNVKIFQTLFF